MSEIEPDPLATRARPPVTVPSLVGAVAGLVLLGSLAGFLSELSGNRLRIGGLGLSLIFEAMGVVLLVLCQGRRAYTAGVTLAALGTVPLVFFVFFDLNDPANSLIGGDDLATTASLALLVAAGLWLAGHVFGPSQSHALFLGAALVAVWLAVVIQVADNGGGRSSDVFGSPALRFASASLAPDPDPDSIPGSATTEDPELRALIEGDRFMSGEVECVGGQLVLGNPQFWACEGDEPYPAELTGPEEFEVLEDSYGVTFDDLRLYGPQDAMAVYDRLEEYWGFDEGLVACNQGELDWGSSAVWTCEAGDVLALRPIDDADRWSRFDDQFADDPFADEFFDDFDEDEFGQFDDFGQFDEFDDDPFGPDGLSTFEEDPFFSNPFEGMVRRIGWTTLLFGAAYLAIAVALDRRRDHRRATAFFAVASPLLYYGATLATSDSVRVTGLLLMVCGAVAAWAGSRTDRRFTAWAGAYAGTGGLITIVLDEVGDSGTVIGLTLLVLGLALAALAFALERPLGAGASTGFPPSGTPSPGADTGAPSGTGVPASPWTAASGAPTGTTAPPLVPPPGSHAGAPPQGAPPSTPPVAPPGGSPPGSASDDPTRWQPPASPAPFDPRPPGSHDPLPRIGPDPSDRPGHDG